MAMGVFYMLIIPHCTNAFLYPFISSFSSNVHNINRSLFIKLHSKPSAEEEADRWRKEAEIIREQARKLEEALGSSRSKNNYANNADENLVDESMEIEQGKTLRNKKVLVVGANGRLGSMVCRYLLRNNPNTKVLAAVHYVGEATTRGYGRLSYEVGAEDGVGQIGAAWSEEKNASFMYTDDMAGYNLQNLRVIDVELLDPVQCMTITEDVDSVIWCATDFNGNQPRAVSGLNLAFLFRAVAAPTKGRVEIEGLTNVLGGLKNGKQSKSWGVRKSVDISSESKKASNDPCSFVLVSTAEDAFEDYITPFGDFKALKRDGERILQEYFPSLTFSILQMARYDENFVDEGLDIVFEESTSVGEGKPIRKRRINRRDAARAAVDALTDESLFGKKVEVYTVER